MTRKDLKQPCCGNCKYGKFEMTNHKEPRFKVEEGMVKVGKCTFDLEAAFKPLIASLPMAVTAHYPGVKVPTMSTCMEPQDHENCPAHVPIKS